MDSEHSADAASALNGATDRGAPTIPGEAGLIGSLRAEIELLKAERDRAIAESERDAASLATMSHELRTPLNSIVGFSELLLEGNLAPEQKEHVETILVSGLSLLELINNILKDAEWRAKRSVPCWERFDPRSTCDAVLRLFQPQAQKKRLDLTGVYDPGLPAFVMGCERSLRQVLINLVGNAVKFTMTGSVRLSVSAGDMPGVLVFAVADTGVGIPDHAQQQLFRRFARIGTNTTEGTGLGLAISLELARAMNGTIDVSSLPGRGSTFTVTLPLNAAYPLEAAA